MGVPDKAGAMSRGQRHCDAQDPGQGTATKRRSLQTADNMDVGISRTINTNDSFLVLACAGSEIRHEIFVNVKALDERLRWYA